MSDDLSGTILGGCKLIRVVGKGGMATVYRGVQLSVERPVAVKVLAPELARDPRTVKRFQREARIIARLEHPHIRTVYDFGHENGLLYIVMQWIEGGNLLDELKRGRMRPERALRLLDQIASALDYAHEQGVIHRDLKPSNILLDTHDNAFLTDFGIARITGEHTAAGLTAPQSVMGTPLYMAPEQWRGEPADERTDIYALGIIAYWMLVGQAPFTSGTPQGLMYKHLHDPPPPPDRLNAHLPHAVADVLGRALAKDPRRRYMRAQEFVHALNYAMQGTQSTSATVYSDSADVPRPETMRRPAPSAQPTVPPSTRSTVGTAGYVRAQPPAPAPSRITRLGGTREQNPTRETVASATPLTSWGKTAPVWNDPTLGTQLPESSSGGDWWRVIKIFMAVTLSVFLLLGVVVGVGLLLSGYSSSGGRSTPAPSATPLATAVPAYLRPQVTLFAPADGSVVGTGQTVTVQFSAICTAGKVTRVELRVGGQVVDAIETGGVPAYQGVFLYHPQAPGTYELDVIGWNDQIAGEAARVTIFVQ